MNGYADLHLHTVASDGTWLIPDLVRRAKEHGLSCIAITDHDVVSDELPGRVQILDGVEVITGVEVKTTFGSVYGEILGFFIDPASPGLRSLLDRLLESRVERMRKMVDLCRERAMIDIDFDDVRAVAAGCIGRPHLARILIDRGVVGSFEEAFRDWIGDRGPCYSPIDRPDHRAVLDAIHEAGGVGSLAHPCLMRVKTWDRFLSELAEAGLDAIEGFYPYAGADAAGRNRSADPGLMRTMAERHGLLLTGGSDDHGRGSTKESIGTVRLPCSRVEALKAALPIPL